MHFRLHERHDNIGGALDLNGAGVGAIAFDPASAHAHYELAIVLNDQGRLKDAATQFRQAIALDPHLRDAYGHLASVLIRQGAIEQAIDWCQQVLRAHPDWTELYDRLGQAFQSGGQFDAAIAAYRETLARNPALAHTHYNLGKIWQQRGDHPAAVACFQAAIGLDPDQPALFSDWAQSYIALGRIQEAMVCLQWAMAQQRPFMAAFCEQTEALTESDDLTQAHIACARLLNALQTEPVDVSAATHSLTQVYVHLANAWVEYGGSKLYRQAERYYHRALQLQPHDPGILRRLQNCQIRQQQHEAAIQHQAIWGIQSTTAAWVATAAIAQSRYIPLSRCSPAAPPRPQASSPPDCLGLNCPTCLPAIQQRFEPVHCGKGLHICTTTAPHGAEPYSLFVGVIPNGRARTVPQRNYWDVCRAIAITTPDHIVLADVSRAYPGQLPGCQNPDLRSRVLDLPDAPPVELIQGTVAVLAGLSGHVYFHWMVDILPRFELLRRAGFDWDEIDWFWVNEIQQPFQQESLNALGIPPEKILSSDRHPHIEAERLVVPSFPGPLGWMQPWILEFLRHRFLPQPHPALLNPGLIYPPDLGTLRGPARAKLVALTPSFRQPLDRHPAAIHERPRRLYISRRGARHRRVLNEPQILPLLKRWGFAPVNLESLSLKEQVALFASAEVIVAPHGSGLTNLAFCRRGTTVIELVSARYIRHYFWVISQSLQLRHAYLVCDSVAGEIWREVMYPNPLTDDLWVNSKALEHALSGMNLAPFDDDVLPVRT